MRRSWARFPRCLASLQFLSRSPPLVRSRCSSNTTAFRLSLHPRSWCRPTARRAVGAKSRPRRVPLAVWAHSPAVPTNQVVRLVPPSRHRLLAHFRWPIARAYWVQVVLRTLDHASVLSEPCFRASSKFASHARTALCAASPLMSCARRVLLTRGQTQRGHNAFVSRAALASPELVLCAHPARSVLAMARCRPRRKTFTPCVWTRVAILLLCAAHVAPALAAGPVRQVGRMVPCFAPLVRPSTFLFRAERARAARRAQGRLACWRCAVRCLRSWSQRSRWSFGAPPMSCRGKLTKRLESLLGGRAFTF
eukprot:Amastigsp_a508393_6.p2 type:complete len:308 gc:universal Amastigsp_a508393_6:1135-2058(+)